MEFSYILNMTRELRS